MNAFTKVADTLQNWQAYILPIIIILTIVVHSVNLFGFPAYREDEGTYMSQAWAVIHEQRLASYTYWYDHAPAGWVLLAGWWVLVGPFTGQLMSVDIGRIFMVIIQAISAFLLYQITYRLTKRKDAAAIATIFFCFTPLAIVLQRRVLLDNIMVLWFLVSLYLIIKPVRLRQVMFSAVAFALSVLSKEPAIIFFPVMLWVVYRETDQAHRHFATVLWATIAIFCISFYPVFALLKNEFFSSGSWLGGAAPHVSLLETIRFQFDRHSGFFLNPGSSFYVSLNELWWRFGGGFLVLGLLAMVSGISQIRRRSWSFVIALLTLLFLIFLLRGQILDWYIIPLLPLFALNIGFLYRDAVEAAPVAIRYRPWLQRGLIGVMGILVIVQLTKNYYIFTLPQTQNQQQAVAWVTQNIPSDRITLIDNYAFVDLNPHLTDITKTNFQYYWKADTDPQIKNQVLNNDWNSIAYLLYTPGMGRSIYQDNLGFVKEAYEKSYVIKRFGAHDILDEGYPVEIREVNNSRGTLQTSWETYKNTFIAANGEVRDLSAGGAITSEGQAYALLRAVWAGDKNTYDKVLQWTTANLAVAGSSLPAWRATDQGTGVMIVDKASAADADVDMALSLLFAAKLWNDPRYIEQSKIMLTDIWNKEVFQVKGLHYLTAGSRIKRADGYLINPSYFSPASYRIFAEVDPSHDWNKLAADSYTILNQVADMSVGDKKTYLVPNWFVVNDAEGTYHSVTEIPDANVYGYDAFRVYWRIALDALWFDTPAAKEYLAATSPFFEKEWADRRQIAAVYTLDGTPHVNYSDISTSAGALSVFFFTQPELAIDLYSETIWPTFANGAWGDDQKYYDQNWGWFATALYAYNVPNLWAENPYLSLL